MKMLRVKNFGRKELSWQLGNISDLCTVSIQLPEESGNRVVALGRVIKSSSHEQDVFI